MKNLTKTEVLRNVLPYIESLGDSHLTEKFKALVESLFGLDSLIRAVLPTNGISFNPYTDDNYAKILGLNLLKKYHGKPGEMQFTQKIYNKIIEDILKQLQEFIDSLTEINTKQDINAPNFTTRTDTSFSEIVKVVTRNVSSPSVPGEKASSSQSSVIQPVAAITKSTNIIAAPIIDAPIIDAPTKEIQEKKIEETTVPRKDMSNMPMKHEETKKNNEKTVVEMMPKANKTVSPTNSTINTMTPVIQPPKTLWEAIIEAIKKFFNCLQGKSDSTHNKNKTFNPKDENK